MPELGAGGLDEIDGNLQEVRDSDPAFALLKEIEVGYSGYRLIVGSLGVQGVLGRETRPVGDVDICVRRGDGTEMGDFLSGLGFSPLPEEAAQKLGGSGMSYSRADGMGVDVWHGDFSDPGLTLPNPKGRLFIPQEGLDSEVELRGIRFRTFSPEVHYFFKDRAVRRSPWKSLSPFNEPKDVADYEELRNVVDPERAKRLLALGFSYTGGHPRLTREAFREIRRRVKLRRKG